MKRLAIITTHPIQYNAPLFKLLTERGNIHLKVFYTWSQSKDGLLFDPGFGIHRSWDIPLLEGYEYEFVENKAKDPGSHHFWGVYNPEIIQKIQSFSPHALLVFGWAFRSHLNLMRYFKGKIPVFFRGDSTWLDMEDKTFIKKAIKRMYLSFIYKYVDKAFYVGLANKKYFSLCGLKNSQLIFAPHAIDNDRFASNKDEYEVNARLWKKKLGISQNNFVFLFAGKLEKKKAPDLLLNAFISLNRQDTTLIICGNGVMEEELKSLAEGRRNIIFLPFQNQKDMPLVYRLGDVFVLPSRGPSETWGLAINEAMACTRPVIASNKCGAAQDLIIDEYTGYVFTSDSLYDLTQKMNSVILLSNHLKVIANNAYRRVLDYSYSNICNEIDSVII